MTLAIVATCLASKVAPAQGGRWERQVDAYLTRAEQTLAQQGFRRTAALPAGPLNTDESVSFPMMLDSGTAYAILAVCDNDCSELNLVLLGSGDTEIATDRRTTVPTLKVTPRATIPYRVKVVMAGCDLNPCWYKVGVYRGRSAVTAPKPLKGADSGARFDG